MTSHILHRQMISDLPVIAGGQGVFLVDTQGKRYLDGSGGAAVSCLGHGHPKVTKAIKRQLDRVAFAHTGFFTNEPAEELANWLCERAPGDFSRVGFVTSGSEATEAALKLVMQINRERGQGERTHFIARLQSYHGATLGALSAGGHIERKATYRSLLSPSFSHIDPCYAYRHQREDEVDEDYGLRAAKALEDEILRVGPEKVAAFIAETVVGSTLGAAAPAPGYFAEIRRICDKYGVLLILDEVMCGMGRTGTLFACEQDGIEPDIITMAKGLGGGYLPVGAVILNSKYADIIVQGSGVLQHGQTYMAHPSSCAGALAVQHVIEEENLLERVCARGDTLMNRLEERFGQNPHVGDIRGRGLFVGVELVEDRESKKPFPVSAGVAAGVKAAAMRNGLICYPSNGTVDGSQGDHILLAPPFIISADELDLLVQRLETSIAETLSATLGGENSA